MEAVANPAKLGMDKARLERIGVWMQRYVEAGRYAGSSVLVARHGQIAYTATTGKRSLETGAAWEPDTLARIYSMTKPVTSVAVMLLYEEGLIRLDDPVDAYLPELASRQVLRSDAKTLADTVPSRVRPSLHHLLTHRSGLTYGFNGGLLGPAYAQGKIGIDPGAGGLAKLIAQLAPLPLEFEPGSRWHYSVATDVLGRIVEVVSGEPFDRFIARRILEPLGMSETGFAVPESRLGRLASLYVKTGDGKAKLVETGEASAHREGKVDTPLGGAGLLSTLPDYWRFMEMLRGGGTFRGERVIGPRTLRLMTSNALEGEIAAIGPREWSQTSFEGVGFGLGVWVMLDPARAHMSGSPGDYGWGGMASTVAWVDPVEDLVAIFLTQMLPSDGYPNRKELRALVHQAIVG